MINVIHSETVTFIHFRIRKFITIILLFFNFAVYAQNQSNLTGKVIDATNHTPLSKATVAVINVKDSSLVSYTVSDQLGIFLLHDLPSNKELKVVISYISYINFRHNFVVDKKSTLDLGLIQLQTVNRNLTEITIKGEKAPVAISKDTIEFSAEAFRVRPNAVVEELLNKLPGVQVNSDGTIMVNGKNVSKMLLNGHEFFNNDSRIASKNIDASMIDKVQIYDDRESDPDHLLNDSKIKKIINLKFKKKYKKSFFGKAYAGAGTDKKYESGFLLNSLRDTLQISLIGFSNNLSHTGFSRDDLSTLGGFDRSGNDQINNGNVAIGGKTADGVEQVLSSGFNINNDYGNKFKINLLFFFNNTRDKYSRSFLNQNFLGDTTLFLNQLNQSNQSQTNYNFSTLIQWNPSSTEQIKYTPHYSTNYITLNNTILSDLLNDYSQRINKERDTIQTFNRMNQFDHSFSYYKKLNDKGTSLTINQKLNNNSINNSNNLNNILLNYKKNIQNDTLRQLNSSIVSSILINTDANFRFSLGKKIIGNLYYNNIYSNDKAPVTALSYNSQTESYNTILQNQTSDISRVNYIQTIRPSLNYTTGNNKTISIELNNQLRNIKIFNKSFYNNNLFFYFLPAINFQAEKYSVSFNQTIQQPNILELNSAIVKVNSYYSYTGNSLLIPYRAQNLTFNFYNYDTKKQVSILVYANGTFCNNAVFSSSFLSSDGVQTVSFSNGGKAKTGFVGANFSKRFNKIDELLISMKSSLYCGSKINSVSINRNIGTLYYDYIIANAEISLNYKDLLEINPRYEFNPSYSKYNNLPYPNINNYNHKLSIKYSFKLLKKISIDGDYTHFKNSTLNTGFQKSYNLLNSSLSLQFDQERRTLLKLTAFDILNQNTNIFRTVNSNGITEGNNLIQRRYFLLTYQYKFLKGKS